MSASPSSAIFDAAGAAAPVLIQTPVVAPALATAPDRTFSILFCSFILGDVSFL